MDKLTFAFKSLHLGEAFRQELKDMGYIEIVPDRGGGKFSSIILQTGTGEFWLSTNVLDANLTLETHWNDALQFAKNYQYQYKVGDWVYGKEPPYGKESGFTWIFKISDIEGEKIRGTFCDSDGEFDDGGFIWLSSIKRKATPDDIKYHLIKAAEKKGFVEGLDLSRCTGITFEGGMYHPGLLARGTLSEHKWRYDSEHDFLFNGDILIYRRGDWCSLIAKPKSTFFHLDVKRLEGRLNIGCREPSNEYLYMIEQDLKRLEMEGLGTTTIAELREELESLIING